MSSRRTVRMAAIAGVMIAVSSGGALAASYHLKDVLRPGGHARSLAAKFADGRSCGATGDHVLVSKAAAFKDCMRTHGWVVDKYTPDPTPRTAQRSPGTRDDTYINEDGMECHADGGIGVCFPPSGTVKYNNDEGLNCTRTGLVSVCSNM